ncbi:RNA dependent RNA polymerase-domain-containing protein [Mycena polygramma]|nr:RNA dependent RNA polymerase-domain-containing protein [Mycena polygramma]
MDRCGILLKKGENPNGIRVLEAVNELYGGAGRPGSGFLLQPRRSRQNTDIHSLISKLPTAHSRATAVVSFETLTPRGFGASQYSGDTAGPHILEVQNISRPPKSGRLNKQFIVLLMTLGVPLSVFEELLQMQLDEIDKITTDHQKALNSVDGEVDAKGQGFYQELYEMLLAGHDMNEPYLASQLCRFQNTSRDALRKKLNIPVELTLVEAFASSGARSETDCMGGGDLDGDQFYVVYNPLLIPEPPEPRVMPAVTVKKHSTRKTIKIGGSVQNVSRIAQGNKDMRADVIKTFMSLRCNFLVVERVDGNPRADAGESLVLINPQDIVKSGGNLAILSDDFDRLRRTGGARRIASWQNPLESLANLVPQAQQTDFIPDPQLILGEQTSEEKWDVTVREAQTVMRAYNMSLQRAIEAEKEAKIQGLQEDEKRADLVKTDIIAKNFPPIQNILEDVPKYLLKASAWYFTGYQSGKQSFAWLGARWLNQIKAFSQHSYVPIPVGARSTALVGVPSPPPSTPPRANVATRLPPTPSLPLVAAESHFSADNGNLDIDSNSFGGHGQGQRPRKHRRQGAGKATCARELRQHAGRCWIRNRQPVFPLMHTSVLHLILKKRQLNQLQTRWPADSLAKEGGRMGLRECYHHLDHALLAALGASNFAAFKTLAMAEGVPHVPRPSPPATATG